MKMIAVTAGLMILMTASVINAKTQEEITGPHLEAGLVCADCHGTDTPATRAPQGPCVDCHGDTPTDNDLSFLDTDNHSYATNIHDSHNGKLRCTLCHANHKPSQLYCNKGCHHNFVIDVP